MSDATSQPAHDPKIQAAIDAGVTFLEGKKGDDIYMMFEQGPDRIASVDEAIYYVAPGSDDAESLDKVFNETGKLSSKEYSAVITEVFEKAAGMGFKTRRDFNGREITWYYFIQGPAQN